jgi:ribose transport system permease protein
MGERVAEPAGRSIRLLGLLARLRARSAGASTGLGLIAIWIVLSFASPYFLTVRNGLNILLEVSTLAILAGGVTVTLIAGEIDLSIASVEAFTGSVLAVGTVQHGVPWPVAIALGLLVGCAAGGVNAYFTTQYGMPSFVTTLAMLGIAQGLAYVVTNGEAVYGLPPQINALGQSSVGPIPTPIVIAVIVLAVVHVVLTRTAFGINVFAVGGNAEAARLAGIDVRRTKFIVLVLSSLLASIAGIVLAARLGAGSGNVAGNDLLDAIAAVVIGGTSLMGGSGSIPGTVVGVILISTIRNGLVLLNVSAFWQIVAIGALILAAVFVDHLAKRVRAR